MKKSNKRSSLKELKAIDSINAKYTYNEICDFHETILRILGSCDLTGLKASEMQSIEFFARTMVRLLDSPQISYSVRNHYQMKVADNIADIKKIRPPKGNDFQTTKSLSELLNWINFTNHRNRLTLEMILDDYYYHFPFPQCGVITENYLLQQPCSVIGSGRVIQ